MPVSTNFGIGYPDGNSNLVPLQDWFATIANGVDNALTTGLGGAPRIANSDSERNTIYPAPVQGNTVVRPDKGYTEMYFALYNVTTNPGGLTVAGWFPVSGRSFRRELYFYAAPSALALPIAGGFADVGANFTTTVTTTGLPIRITYVINAANAVSGAARSVTTRVLQDGSLIGPGTGNVQVGYLSTTDAVTITETVQVTPSAGSHTYKIQVSASTASALVVRGGSLQVEEIIT